MIKYNEIKMEGERVILRPLSLDDRDQIYENVKKKEDRPFAYIIPYPYAQKDAVEFIENSIKKGEAREEYQLAIESKETGELIGSCGLHSMDWDHRHGELGYLIRAKDRGQGYATEAAKLLLKLGFEEFKLNKISAKCFDENPASKRVMEKIGMTQEGLFRKQMYLDGIYHDEARYAILRKEWLDDKR